MKRSEIDDFKNYFLFACFDLFISTYFAIFKCIWRLLPRVFLTLLAPGVLLTDLLQLLRRPIICDVESLSNFFWRFTRNHAGDGFATDVQQRTNVQVVGGQDQLKQRSLVDLVIKKNNLGKRKKNSRLELAFKNSESHNLTLSVRFSSSSSSGMIGSSLCWMQ